MPSVAADAVKIDQRKTVRRHTGHQMTEDDAADGAGEIASGERRKQNHQRRDGRAAGTTASAMSFAKMPRRRSRRTRKCRRGWPAGRCASLPR